LQHVKTYPLVKDRPRSRSISHENEAFELNALRSVGLNKLNAARVEPLSIAELKSLSNGLAKKTKRAVAEPRGTLRAVQPLGDRFRPKATIARTRGLTDALLCLRSLATDQRDDRCAAKRQPERWRHNTTPSVEWGATELKSPESRFGPCLPPMGEYGILGDPARMQR